MNAVSRSIATKLFGRCIFRDKISVVDFFFGGVAPMKPMLFLIALMLLAACARGLVLCTSPGGGTGTTIVTITNRFIDLVASRMHRDVATTQITLAGELALPKAALQSGYRQVPDFIKDTDGGSGIVTVQARPSTICGTTQATVESRVADCAALNGSLASWIGATNGNNGQGNWKLVTFNGAHEVWRDEQTTLLWSDDLGSIHWCRASGVSGGGPYGQVDPASFCDNAGNQNQVTPDSACTEDAGFTTSAAYNSMKGGMRLAATGSSPAISWRLPTANDYHQAELDGIRFALPNMANDFWTSTIVRPPFSSDALYYSGDIAGGVVITSRNNVAGTRCVGR